MREKHKEKVSIFLLDAAQLHSKGAAAYYHLISVQRQQKAEAFLREKDRLQCVAAGILANFCLWKFCKERLRSMTICRNTYGKPLFESNSIYFNLSHAGRWATCAVATVPVGVDIEHIRVIDPGLFQLCLASDERWQIQTEKADRDARFIHIWTIKESFAKMRGDGLQCGMNRFTVDLPFQAEIKETSYSRTFIRDIWNAHICGESFSTKVSKDFFLSICLPDPLKTFPAPIIKVSLADMTVWARQPDPVRLL